MTGAMSGVILVVEDEALLLFAIADDLREFGFNVLEARNADEAVTRLEAHPEISAVFTDIDMPGSMDGVQLSVLVDGRWPDKKVVITSGKTRPAAGVIPARAHFLPKPYVVEAVARAVG